MSKDFSYLKTWLDNARRPVVLECVPSRSGLSLSVYDREALMFRVPAAACGGGNYTALDRFMEACFTRELASINTNWPPEFRERGYDIYGRGPKVGSPDMDSAIKIAEAIGLTVQVHETRSSTLLIIQRRSGQ